MRLFHRTALGLLAGAMVLGPVVLAQQPGTPAKTAKPTSDMPLVRSLLECRSKYQETLEQLRLFYMSSGDLEKARWAEDELRQYHRAQKHAYNMALELPSEKLQAAKNIPE